MTEEELKHIQLKRDYMNTFNSEHGKKVLEHLRYNCYMDSPIDNPIEEGMRRVYLHIETMTSREGMEEEKKEDNAI